MVTQQLMPGEGLEFQEDYLRIKRLLDIMLALLALIPAGIVMLVTVIAIRIDSPGPVIFRQKRLGIYGTEFYLYKFRSMYHNVDSRIHEEATARFISGSVINSADATMPYKLGADRRITRVGKFIRKTSIDELPQLWNVLKGDM